MGNLNYFDRVRYTLFNKNQGSLIIEEPIGWKSDEKELARHEQYHGIISRFSNSSKFIGDGKEFIQLVDDIDGINADIQLKREEKHPQTDVWNLGYSGNLDLSTKETENNQIAIKFNSGGLEQILKARESESVEIDRTTTIDGKTIPDILPITVALDGRRIFLKSKLETKLNDNSLSLYCESNTGNTRNQTAGIPFSIINKSHEQVQEVLSGNTASENTGTTGMMFFANSDKKRTLHIKTNFTFKFDAVSQDHVDWSTFSINLTKFKNGVDYNTPTRITLFSLSSKSAIGGANGKTFSVNYDGIIDVESGESLAIEAFEKADFKSSPNAKLAINLTEILGTLFVEEDSHNEKSTTKAILAHELMDRLVTIATGKEKAFYSDFLGRTDLGYTVDGPGALTAVTHGFWIRQFDKLPIPSEATATTSKIENLFKPLTTSFKDAVASLDSVWNIGIGIEIVGNKERVRMEELSFFYNNNVTIRLGQVKKVKRSCATEYYYSSLEFGSEKGGTYEEAMGLDEPNGKSNFTTVINRLKSTYSKLSKYRFDTYGMEFARRKPKSLNDTEDTPYDSDNFMIDLKRGITATFEQRKWQDDFENEPTGIFDPSSATNLRFSPVNCLLRHSWWFGGGFKKYLTDYVRYGSSSANSQLKTKLMGKNEYSENGNIINSELFPARFFPEWIEFEYECGFSTMQMVEGKTIIKGKEIMNFYGLVEFTNENNEKEKGFLFNLKPNGKGQWKLLKSNR
jgi:hypothetical protein